MIQTSFFTFTNKITMQITTTLNRIHKFIERLTAKNNELRVEVVRLSQPVHVQLARGMTELPIDPTGRSKEAVAILTKIFDISKTICALKIAVMKTNATIGISSLLVEQQLQAFSKAIITQLKTFSDRDGYTNVATAKQMLKGLLLGSEGDAISVQLIGLDDALINQLDGILQEYTTRINEIADAVSDLNRENVEVEIPENLLAIVGISEK